MLCTRSFRMTLTKINIVALVTALVIVIATTAFFNVVVLAQTSNSTPTGTTTTSSSASGQQSTTIHITKDGTNSYVMTGQMSSVGSFDTTYRVAGERDAITQAETLIISTITSDFTLSPTVGYIRVGNMSAIGANSTALANPFATTEMISQKITKELTNTIGQAESNTAKGQHIEIVCEFGMTLQDMRCQYTPLLAIRQGALSSR